MAQLHQAQADFKSSGIFNSFRTGGTLEKEAKAVRDKMAIDFDLASVPLYAEDEQCAKLLPPLQPEEAYMWANSLVEKVVAGGDVQFLAQVLNPEPNARLNLREILDCGYLEG